MQPHRCPCRLGPPSQNTTVIYFSQLWRLKSVMKVVPDDGSFLFAGSSLLDVSSSGENPGASSYKGTNPTTGPTHPRDLV